MGCVCEHGNLNAQEVTIEDEVIQPISKEAESPIVKEKSVALFHAYTESYSTDNSITEGRRKRRETVVKPKFGKKFCGGEAKNQSVSVKVHQNTSDLSHLTANRSSKPKSICKTAENPGKKAVRRGKAAKENDPNSGTGQSTYKIPENQGNLNLV